GLLSNPHLYAGLSASIGAIIATNSTPRRVATPTRSPSPRPPTSTNASAASSGPAASRNGSHCRAVFGPLNATYSSVALGPAVSYGAGGRVRGAVQTCCRWPCRRGRGRRDRARRATRGGLPDRRG